MSVTMFSPGSEGVLPLDVYSSEIRKQIIGREHYYASGPVTSGGAVRLRDEREMTTKQIIDANTNFALTLMQLLSSLPQIDGHSITLPHTVGSRVLPGENARVWKDSEYLPLWMMTMFRMTPELAGGYWEFIQQQGINFEHLNSHHLGRTRRVPEYQMLEQATLDFVDAHQSDTDPVTGVIRLPDSALSLGSTLEQRIAQRADIPIFEVGINPQHPSFSELEVSRDEVCQLLLRLGVMCLSTENSVLASLQPVLDQLQYQME